MREYKVTYETPLLGYTKIRDSKIVWAESKHEAVKIAVPSNYKFISVRLMPIKKLKKPFDITKHKFSEEDIECELAAGNNLLLINNTGYNCIPFNKSDAIAIAQALGVTGEDLK